MFIKTFKSWLWLALFFTVICCPTAYSNEQHTIKSIHLSEKWYSLLHLKNKKPQIVDPKFLLSYPNFSPELELKKTVELIKKSPQIAACRFPARYLFLSDFIAIDKSTILQANQCPELKRYIDYVPFDKVSLVFASEVITSASSMMGHTFLKASGKNNNGISVNHSVSFFTEFSSLNPVSIFYDATISGMNGFFIVRPFSVDVEQYVNKEGRNLWSYQLTLSEKEKSLLKFHIWELKDLDIKYLFQSYNCATLTLYLLSIAKPELKKQESLFVSPMDVVKAVNNQGVVDNNNVILSYAWELNMLKDSLTTSLQKQLDAAFLDNISLDLNTFDVETQLVIKRYYYLLSKINPKTSQIASKIQQQLFQDIQTEKFEDLKVDLSYYKNPINTPQDSAMGISYIRQENNYFFDFSFMPASHYLYGDNSQYFSESELKMGEITLRTDTKFNKLSIQSLILYSIQSLNPSTNLMPSLSGDFFLGLKSVYNKNLKEQRVFELSGSLGKSYNLHKDILVYALFGGGVGLRKINVGYAFLQSKMGMLVNSIGSTKVKVEHNTTWGQINSGLLKNTTSLTWSWNGNKNKIFSLYISSNKSEHMKENIAKVKLDILF